MAPEVPKKIKQNKPTVLKQKQQIKQQPQINVVYLLFVVGSKAAKNNLRCLNKNKLFCLWAKPTVGFFV
jgi:hypothetical protein